MAETPDPVTAPDPLTAAVIRVGDAIFGVKSAIAENNAILSKLVSADRALPPLPATLAKLFGGAPTAAHPHPDTEAQS